jgi:hypothetical protein
MRTKAKSNGDGTAKAKGRARAALDRLRVREPELLFREGSDVDLGNLRWGTGQAKQRVELVRAILRDNHADFAGDFLWMVLDDVVEALDQAEEYLGDLCDYVISSPELPVPMPMPKVPQLGEDDEPYRPHRRRPRRRREPEADDARAELARLKVAPGAKMVALD